MTQGEDECRIVEVTRRPIAMIRESVPMAEIPQAQRRLRARLKAALPELGAGPYGEWLTLWRPPVDGMMDIAPGVLCAHGSEGRDGIEAAELPVGRAAHVVLIGGYEGVPGAWVKLFRWCNAKGEKLEGVNWEIYHEEGGKEPRTEFYALLA